MHRNKYFKGFTGLLFKLSITPGGTCFRNPEHLHSYFRLLRTNAGANDNETVASQKLTKRVLF